MIPKAPRPRGSITSQRAAGSEFLGRSFNPQNSQLSCSGQDIKRPRNTHIFERAAHDLYIEPPWVSERLFAVETFPGVIVDPCCGTGMIPEAARAAGLSSYASDIADHGYGECPRDFLTQPAPTTSPFSVVTNPPYGLAREIVERAFEFGALKVAIFFPIARMNAAWRWLTTLPLAHMYLVTPRPSVPPRAVFDGGEKAKNGRPDFIWLILDRTHEGEPTWNWLHRDGEVPLQCIGRG